MNFGHVDDLMRTAVRQRNFPGAVLLVAREGAVVFERAYGAADLFRRSPMSLETCFDLASLTKPLATAVAAMLLVQRAQLDLDRPCCHYDRSLKASDKESLTPRQLLSHCAGLPAFRPYFMRLRQIPPKERQGCLMRWLTREPLLYPPGEHAVYSDLGFLVLQRVIETVTQQRLDCFLHGSVYQPLGIKRLFFPGILDQAPKIEFAATELCPLRGRLLKGEVHDDNANAMGGVGGHAGLFGTARGVYDLLQILLDGDQGGRPVSLCDSAIVRHFFERRKDTNWALGFDTPAPEGSSAGRFFSRRSVGHLGFTGTSFWMERDRALIVILLTNRVHPSRYNIKIRAFRPILHDAVFRALGAPG